MQDIGKFELNLPEGAAQLLYREMAGMAVIDAHEHLFPESYRISLTPDAALLFADQYPVFGLLSSGMSREDLDRVGNRTLPLDERWALVDRIAAGETTEARAVELARMMLFQNAVELYGLEKVGALTYC